MRNFIISCTFILWGFTMYAQIPNTNIYLFDLGKSINNGFEMSKPQFLTVFNKQGYNNQPSFLNNDELFITVKTPDQPQTDIYLLDIAQKRKTRFTATSESEYSPIVAPRKYSAPGELEISCVRVTADETKQELWIYPFNRKNSGEKAIAADFTNIGYYNWLNSSQVALFLVGEPHELVIYDKAMGQSISIADNTGRCIQSINTYGDFAFVAKTTDGDWLLKQYNARNRETKLITAMLKGVEDFVVLKDETFITAKGSKVYKFNAKQDITWQEIADLSEFDIDNITRLAVNPSESKIAIVVKK